MRRIEYLGLATHRMGLGDVSDAHHRLNLQFVAFRVTGPDRPILEYISEHSDVYVAQRHPGLFSVVRRCKYPSIALYLPLLPLADLAFKPDRLFQ
jgi:hypothetical protein